MSFVVVKEWASQPSIIKAGALVPVVVKKVTVAPLLAVRVTPVAPEVVLMPEEGGSGETFRAVRTFGAMPSEADLRYPATLKDGKWIKAAKVDPKDPNLLEMFCLVGAEGFADGLYRSTMANNTGAFVMPTKRAG